MSTQHLIVPVSGLSCAGCVNRLQKGLQQKPEVKQAQANLALETLDVELLPDVSAANLVDWVADIGYQVPVITETFELTGISCAGCINTIETQLLKQSGVTDVAVNLATGQAKITWIPGVIDRVQIVQILADIGYPVADHQATDTAETNQSPRVSTSPIWPVLLAAALSLPMVSTMVLSLFGVNWILPVWVQWLLTTPVQFWLGARFYSGAWKSLKHGSANMDVLVVLGTSTAYFYSLYLWSIQATHTYFEAAAVIITLILLGKWMEHRAKRLTGEAIRKLMTLQPKTAQVWQGDQLVEKPVASLNIGDEIQVQPGDTLPVDGEIVSGQSDLDESMLTGESRAISKSQGAQVLAGTRNLDGALRVRTSTSPNQFRLKQIVQLVENAQMSKPPIQNLVDKIAAYFVPAIVLIALITLFIQGFIQGWETGLLTAVSVLVIACPCALGLAVPTAIIAASGAGARHGILIRDISQLEKLAHADVVIFDKTGTLTVGQPEVVNQTIWTDQAETMLAQVLAVQQQSQHPLARAMVDHLAAQSLPGAEPVEDFRNQSGQGVVARAAGHQWLIGNKRLLDNEGVAIDHADAVNNLHSLVWVAKDGHVVACFELADQPRPEAKSLIEQLKHQHIEPWILSGDLAEVVSELAGQLGIEHFQGNLLPEHKLQIIQQLQTKGKTVVMVGDGINDAPALAKADASIAMGSGTDVAMETAGLTLMRSDLGLLSSVHQLARRSYLKIQQNLFWAFIYNVIGIPLAALGLLNPMIAGAAMAFSSVSVVSSSLLLLRWKPKELSRENQ